MENTEDTCTVFLEMSCGNKQHFKEITFFIIDKMHIVYSIGFA